MSKDFFPFGVRTTNRGLNALFMPLSPKFQLKVNMCFMETIDHTLASPFSQLISPPFSLAPRQEIMVHGVSLRNQDVKHL